MKVEVGGMGWAGACKNYERCQPNCRKNRGRGVALYTNIILCGMEERQS